MEGDKGKKLWVFPDLEMPQEGSGGLKGHESIIILNINDKAANVKITLYFEDKEPIKDIAVTVGAQRVRCLRTNSKKDFGIDLPKNTQYAMKLESDLEIVAQYGRLDVSQPNMAFYTVMGYCK